MPTEATSKEPREKSKSPKDWLQEHLWQVVGGIVLLLAGAAITKATTREASLTAEIRHGREAATDANAQDSGFYDILLRNDGKKPAKAVRLVVPDALSLSISKSPGHAAEVRPVLNEAIDIGDMTVGDSMSVFVRVRSPTTERSAELIRLSQEDGDSSKRIYEWARQRTWWETISGYSIPFAIGAFAGVAMFLFMARGLLVQQRQMRQDFDQAVKRVLDEFEKASEVRKSVDALMVRAVRNLPEPPKKP